MRNGCFALFLFESIYEDNEAGKISNERFSRLSQKYEQEQGEVTAKIKALRLELKKSGWFSITTASAYSRCQTAKTSPRWTY